MTDYEQQSLRLLEGILTELKAINCNTTKKKPAKREPNKAKHKHGNYNHVLLTVDERDKLIKIYGNRLADAVQYLDDAIEEKAYKYNSHYQVMAKSNSWVREAILGQQHTQSVLKQELF